MLDAEPHEVSAAFWKAHGLRTMTANALVNAGIRDFETLEARQPHSLKAIDSIGRKGIAEINALLAQRAAPDAPTLANHSDADLVMELLRRGYRIDRPPNA